MSMKQQQPQRPLEEVLRDPAANWDEIRCAIKRQGSACTNVAIMQALANEQSWATAAVATAIVMKEEEKQKQQVDQNHEESNNLETNDSGDLGNSGDLERGCGTMSNFEADDEAEAHVTPLPIDDDLKESIISTENETNNVKSSFRRRRGRRGSSGLGTSFRSGRRRGTRRNSGSFLAKSSFKDSSASINVMDFGVTETILDLSDSNRTGADSNLRESEFSDDISKSGFMGWKHHDDMSVRSSYTLNRSFQLDSSDKGSIILSEGDVDDLKESFSNLVDSSGFLDWRHSVRRRTSSGDDDEDEIFLDWRHSERRRTSVQSSFIDTVDEVEDELSCKNEEIWNIDDYDGPDIGVHSYNHNPMSAFTNRLKRFGSTRGGEIDRKEYITISDVQQALLNVRNVESDNRGQEQSTSRRCSAIANQTHTGGIDKTKITRRKTVIGNVAMLGAMLPVHKSNTKRNGERQEDNHLGSLTGANEPTKTAPNRRRITIMDGISPFVGIRKDQVEKVTDTPTHDDRKAIRISRHDGDVDIERECRMLYGDLEGAHTAASK